MVPLDLISLVVGMSAEDAGRSLGRLYGPTGSAGKDQVTRESRRRPRPPAARGDIHLPTPPTLAEGLSSPVERPNPRVPKVGMVLLLHWVVSI